MLFLALNAKYSHTSLAVRCLREMVPGSEILELTINDQLGAILAEIYARQPRVLGIACYIWNIELVKPLLRLLPKALPQTVLICGGPEVSYETGAFLRAFPMVDFVIRGEGEQVAAALCEGLRRHGGETGAWADAIPGLAFRDPSGQVHEGAPVAVADLSRLPFPYRAEEIPAIREKILYYETSRGCPFSCAYCLSCATSGVRFLPLSRVFRELDFFVTQNVRQVKLVDRTFNAKKSHFLPILRHLLALPLGMIGVTLTLILFAAPFGFVAMLGVIALAGMIMRNSVILVDQIEHDIREGIDRWEAVVGSTVRRFRPIMLTAAAAILAMIPLTRSTFWGPMAVAIMGGLLVATVLTLLFLPALYAAWFKVKRPA